MGFNDPNERTELIITSSSLPESDLCGDLILPLTAQATPPKRSLINVHVVSEDGRQWLLKPKDCLTYIVSEYRREATATCTNMMIVKGLCGKLLGYYASFCS
jgi:hypothetical protein